MVFDSRNLRDTKHVAFGAGIATLETNCDGDDPNKRKEPAFLSVLLLYFWDREKIGAQRLTTVMYQQKCLGEKIIFLKANHNRFLFNHGSIRYNP